MNLAIYGEGIIDIITRFLFQRTLVFKILIKVSSVQFGKTEYYKHQGKAKLFPNRYLSLIIDGMDQSKTSLPHFAQASKFTSAMSI